MSERGVGMLAITAHDGAIVHWVALLEGGLYLGELAGHQYRFELQKAPLPSEFDIRQMTALQIAQALVAKVKQEDDEREQDAIERGEWAE